VDIRIGHVGLRVTDLEGSVRFAETIMGLHEVERDGRTSYLSCNERHHELMLIEAESPGCDHLAFEVFGDRDLDVLGERLDARGVRTLEEPTERGVAEAVRFVAPGGFVLEVFHGMESSDPPRSASGVRPRKFEHITVKSSEKDALEDVLQEVLGLRVSDRAEEGASWLRAGAEHHGFSVIRAEENLLHHYAWQTDGWDAIRRIGDHLLANEMGFLWGPGHHGIGDNYFCYFLDPEGAIVEYSACIALIEDEANHKPGMWVDEPLSVNRWGNPPPPPEFLAGGVPLVHPFTANPA
jgi:catechol-2,3-dioxygenase